ncbi:hypothetical protein CAL11_10070 [Bordetella genomosp. 6]|nr:hypothetical protein CAL11_10070 [Bordetella genomosp. 6]
MGRSFSERPKMSRACLASPASRPRRLLPLAWAAAALLLRVGIGMSGLFCAWRYLVDLRPAHALLDGAAAGATPLALYAAFEAGCALLLMAGASTRIAIAGLAAGHIAGLALAVPARAAAPLPSTLWLVGLALLWRHGAGACSVDACLRPPAIAPLPPMADGAAQRAI